MQQLPLNIQLRDDATFANFYAGQNRQLLYLLQSKPDVTRERLIFISGEPGSGRTHLLHASCHLFNEMGFPSSYLSLRDIKKLSPIILEELEQLPLVCLDDIDGIANNSKWEEAIFDLYNRIHTSGTRLLITAAQTPPWLTIKLADLKSRLSSMATFMIQPLSDEEKLLALKQRAQHRGLKLSEEAAHFILNHCPRNTPTLFAILEQLDQASLAAKRRLTIPFIKTVLKT